MQQPGLPAGFQVEGKLFPPRLLPSGSLQAGMLPALTLSVCSCLVPIRAGCSGFDPDGFCHFTVKMYLLVRNATRNWRGFSSFLINGEVFHPNGRAVRNYKVCSQKLGSGLARCIELSSKLHQDSPAGTKNVPSKRMPSSELQECAWQEVVKQPGKL